MTRINSITRLAAALIVATLIAVPGFAARGTADFTRFVAIGDSYGAGFESGSLNERHQAYSWPNILARQANAPDFVQPLVSFPGIGAELQLVDIVRFPPVIAPAPGSGQPLLLSFPRPYNNLSIPGATVGDVTTLRGNEQNPSRTPEVFARFILRGQGTAVQQALAQNPTFIALWLGGNDFLGAVLSGTPRALTSTENFRTAYNRMLDQLVAGAPNAGMVVGTLPVSTGGSLFRSIPVTSVAQPVIINPATRQPVLGPNGQPIFLVADLGGGQIGQLTPGSFVLLTAASKLATGYGIPSTLANTPPFNQLPDVGKPLADTDVLTPGEVTTIEAQVVEYNRIITDAARARDIPVADIAGLFNRVATGQEFVGPFNITSAYITGGFFSLDGFHLTDIGYALFANEYIRTINANYGTRIPVAGMSQFMQNNGAFFGFGDDVIALLMSGVTPELSTEAVQSIMRFATPVPQRRMRTITH